MNLITSAIKGKIEDVVTYFENGSLSDNNYGSLVCYQDGRKVRGIKTFQITYGVRCVTEQGALAELIEMYCKAENALYAEQLRKFLKLIGVTPLVHNNGFKRILIAAGDDPVMQATQDLFFDLHYWQPAFNFFTDNGFKLPLSMLVIYDSEIHSGQVLPFLRKRFDTVPPIRGGNEKEWVSEYVRVRDQWLEFNADPLLRKTDYRTDCLLGQIEIDNWDLSLPVKILDGHGKPMGNVE
jgi:chitosanase